MKNRNFVRSIQSVLFTAPYTLQNKLDFANEFVKRNSRIFSTDPNIITSPSKPSSRSPELEIRNPDMSGITRFGKNRIDFQHQDTQNRRASLEAIFPGFLKSLNSQIQCIMEFLNPKVVRLGIVVQYIYELSGSANRELSMKCFQNNPFPDAREINLGVLHKIMLNEFTANRWIRYRTLRARNDPSIDFAMAVDADINTLSEEMLDFSASAIREYYQLCFEHLDSLGGFPLLDMGGDEESNDMME